MKSRKFLVLVAIALETAAFLCIVLSRLDQITERLDAVTRSLHQKTANLRSCKSRVFSSDCYDDEFEDWED